MTGDVVPDGESFFSRIRLQGGPAALAGSTVERAKLRVTVLTPQLLRLEWSAAGAFEDRATFAFPTREAPTPAFVVSEAGGILTIDTGKLALRYRLNSGPFTPDNLSISVLSMPEPVTWRPGMINVGNLRGTSRTLDGAAGAVTLGEGLISRDGWSLYDDSRFVVLTEDSGWVAARPATDLQDWYFFGYGHDYIGAIKEYAHFGGRVPLIPRYVLGAWWSRFWAYSDVELKQLVADFAAHDLPLDVLVLDMDWHTPHSWTGYSWNRELFPDPEGFIRWAHDQGLRLTLNLHPAEGVQPFEEVYPHFAHAIGIDPSTRQPVPFRAGDPTFMQHYFELLHHPLEDQGVDFWWLDWQQGETSDIQGLDPLLWLNHLHFLDSARRGRRPMLYSRWGGLGNHRYPIGFSGDTYSVWPALAFQPYFSATASNVLYGWWSHDIGGHFGASGPELFTRWVQYGALSPCLRLHSAKDPAAERRPWAHPQPVLEAARAAFHLRYSLVPYLYTMARTASDTGVGLCRPLYHAYPEEEAAYAARDCYFLGDDLIAAPIVRPANPATGLASADVWVPPGAWYDYQTGERFVGPRWVRLFGDLARMPLLVREGTILPLAPPGSRAGGVPAGDLALEVFPGRTGSFELYEDDGETLAYLQGEHEWTPITMRAEEGRCHLSIGPTVGRCGTLPPVRSYSVIFREALRPARVLLSGRPTPWRYDEILRRIEVQVPASSKHAEITLEIEAEERNGGRIWADPDQHNRDCALADVRRLLGGACLDAPFVDLPAAVAALNHPGREHALARLGGPFVVAMHNTVLPDATRSLGRVVVVGPADGSEWSARVTWVLNGPVQERQHTDVTGTSDLVLSNPLTFSGEAQPQIAGSEIVLRWTLGTLVCEERSSAHCPAVSHWQIAVYDPENARPAPELARDGASLSWQTYDADPASLSALTDAFFVQLEGMRQAAIEAGKPMAAVAVARIVADRERVVRVACAPLGEGSVWVNGHALREAEPGTAPELDILPPMGWEAYISEPVLLPGGESTLVLDLRPNMGDPIWKYRVQAAIVSEDGAIATGLRFVR